MYPPRLPLDNLLTVRQLGNYKQIQILQNTRVQWGWGRWGSIALTALHLHVLSRTPCGQNLAKHFLCSRPKICALQPMILYYLIVGVDEEIRNTEHVLFLLINVTVW